MPINLKKGNATPVPFQKLLVGAGWDPPKGDQECDIDLVTLMLGQDHKLPQEEFFVYYNNAVSLDGAVVYSGDDRTGGSSDRGDDESMTLDLSRVRRDIVEILFFAVIQDAEAQRLSFGVIRNAFLRLVDMQTQVEVARFRLDEEFVHDTAVKFGRLVRRGGEWEFVAAGQGSRATLEQVISQYV